MPSFSAIFSFIQLFLKVSSQALTMFNTIWAQIKLELKENEYESAGKLMDKAITNYHTAIYKKDMAAAAQALHDLASGSTSNGGNK